MNILKHGIISRNPDSLFRHYGWPTVCKDEDGILYAVASGCRAAHVCPFGKTLLWKSTDEGNSWSLPMIVNDTWLDDRDAGIVSLGGKKLLISWFEHSANFYQNILREHILKDQWAGCESVLDMYGTIPADKRHGGSYIRISEDGGFSWGETVKVPVSSPHGPIQLKDGTIFYVGKQMYADNLDIPDGNYENCFIQAWASADGKEWTYRGRMFIPEDTTPQNFAELHAIELTDGRIMAIIRADGVEISKDPDACQSCYTMYQSFSDDGGRSWTPMERLNVNGAPPHLLRHSSGAIILSYGKRLGPCGQRAIISYDEGETWSEEYIIDDVPMNEKGFYRIDLGYPASVELSDGSILTVYYQSYDNDPMPSILYTRWTL